MLTSDNLCPECGGVIAMVAEPGRVRSYRGDDFEIPSDFVIPTCQQCGALWLDSERVKALGNHFEACRQS